ncbi:MAG: hypothetical protein KDC98_21115 [Planctomycetes bacterium]|nr:hypothetical protein [Planctomycetota bacterium]
MATDPAFERSALRVLEVLLGVPATERELLLAELCDGDCELRSRVEALLAKTGLGEVELDAHSPTLRDLLARAPLPDTGYWPSG